jgi:ABC-2 type transport system ATP-binding protein
VTPTAPPPARTVDLAKRYRGVTALDGVTAEVRPGAITGLLGRNGSGKSTLLSLIAGHARPSGGRVEVFGEDPYENPSVLPQVCLVRESQRYSSFYRVADVLTAAGLLYPSWDQRFAEALLADFELPPTRSVKKLSLGMRSAVGCIVGLAARAPLTLFDEPNTGLDAVARRVFYDRLTADLAEQPRTVVVSTHLIDEVARWLDHVLVLHRGRVLLDDAVEDLGLDAGRGSLQDLVVGRTVASDRGRAVDAGPPS